MNYIDTNNNIFFTDIAGNIVPHIATIKGCIHPTTSDVKFITMDTQEKATHQVCKTCGSLVKIMDKTPVYSFPSHLTPIWNPK